MNRADLIRLKLAGEAVSRAAREALEAEARHDWTYNGTASSWRTPVGTAYASITGNRVEVVDEQVFLDWLAENYPSEIEMRPTVRNPGWLKMYLEQLADAVQKGVADAPPGTKPVAGGDFKSLTVRPDARVHDLIQQAARGAVQLGEGLEVEKILAEADRLGRVE